MSDQKTTRDGLSGSPAGSSDTTTFTGNDKVLFGIIFGVLAFWLFAQTTLNIAPVMAEDLGVETNIMNIAVSITALFSGMFIVVMGGLADRLGRVRVLMWGLCSALPVPFWSVWRLPGAWPIFF